jgi:hypothetical protein
MLESLFYPADKKKIFEETKLFSMLIENILIKRFCIYYEYCK